MIRHILIGILAIPTLISCTSSSENAKYVYASPDKGLNLIHLRAPLNFASQLGEEQRFIFTVNEVMLTFDPYGGIEPDSIKEYLSLEDHQGNTIDYVAQVAEDDGVGGAQVLEITFEKSLRSKPLVFKVSYGSEVKEYRFNHEDRPVLSYVFYEKQDNTHHLMFALSEKTELKPDDVVIRIDGEVTPVDSAFELNTCACEDGSTNTMYTYSFQHTGALRELTFESQNGVYSTTTNASVGVNSTLSNPRIEQSISEDKFKYKIQLNNSTMWASDI